MSQWTSKYAILRDLSRAQGDAGGSLVAEPRLLLATERPPRLCLQEETEEEFFQHCVGDRKAGNKPDLGLIQQMLDMVRDLNVAEEEVRSTDVAVISKLNPHSSEFLPGSAIPVANRKSPHETPLPEETSLSMNGFPSSMTISPSKKPRKRQRNIALESIFQAMESREPTGDLQCNSEPNGYVACDCEPVTLLKPEDLVPNVNIDTKVKSEAVEKVNDWMTQMLSPIKTKPARVLLDSTNMFKKKSKPGTSKLCVDMDPSAMFKRKDLQESKACNGNMPSSGAKGVAAYVPSAEASRFYQKYLEKSQLMDSLNDDIWTKAEKQMKYIDEKKRILAAQRAAEANTGEQVEAEATTEAEAESEASATLAAASSASCSSELSQRTLPGAGAGAGVSWRNVKLTQHRHLLSPSCTVCDVIHKHYPHVDSALALAPPEPDVTPLIVDGSHPSSSPSPSRHSSQASSTPAEGTDDDGEAPRSRESTLQRMQTLVDLTLNALPTTHLSN